MYTLLPAMKGITASMPLQAIAEMEQAYTGEHLRRHLRRFRTILRRSRTLAEQDKQLVEAKMHSYDSLLESDPEIQQMKTQVRQEDVVFVVETRFPDLVEIARRQVVRLNKNDDLHRHMKQMILAPDERIARWVLDTFAA